MVFLKYFYLCILLVAYRSSVMHALEKNGTDANENYATQLFPLLPSKNMTDINNETRNTLISCSAFSLEPDEYILFPNGSAYVAVYNKTYVPSAYRLINDSIIVCPPEKEGDSENGSSMKFNISFIYITRIGLSISMVCLVLHLVVFFVVSDMRNLPGCNLASLCFSLLFGYMFFMIADTKSIANSGVPCIWVAATLQFFMLSSFLWMSAIAFDVFTALLKAIGKLGLTCEKPCIKKFYLYSLYSWGMSLLIVIATLILDNIGGVPENITPAFGTGNVCWFQQKIPLLIFFTAPVMIIVMSNVILFGLSAYIIFANRMNVDEDQAKKNMLKKNFLMCGRLATIMGLAWFTGILANLFNTIWLWYICVLLNTLQGFFIFIAFTCTQNVKRCIVAKFKSHKRNSSPQPESYWNTSMSLENGLDFSSDINVVKEEKV